MRGFDWSLLLCKSPADFVEKLKQGHVVFSVAWALCARLQMNQDTETFHDFQRFHYHRQKQKPRGRWSIATTPKIPARKANAMGQEDPAADAQAPWV